MKEILVVFENQKTEQQFESLTKGKSQDKQLHRAIKRCIDVLKKNPACGIKISKKLWPKTYVKTYGITNLWKYDLPNAWRLVYTIKEDDVMILNIILEWFNHKSYEKRFMY